VNILERQFVHGGNIYAEQPAGREWIDFSANINPLGLSREILAAMQQNLSQVVHYPDPEGRELKTAIAAFYDVSVHEIVLGNGAAELLYVYFHIFRPQRVLLPAPSFSEYERAALSSGADVAYFPLVAADDFAVCWDALLAGLPETDCVIFGNPNNPTGTLITRPTMERCIQAAAAVGTTVIVDESFIEFLPDEQNYTVRALAAKYSNLFVLQSLTKFYAIPGLRLGFGLLAPEAVKKMEFGKDPWNVNLLAQQAGVAALQNEAYQRQSRDFVAREKIFLYDALRQFSTLHVYVPAVNFIFIDLGKNRNSTVFTAQMRRQGILVRDCANYPGLGDTYIRVAVKSRAENEILLAAFQQVLERKP
jgi:threonine-phosphate decarboxylase